MPEKLDPFDIDARTDRQLDVILTQLEDEPVSVKDRAAIVQIVERTHGMIQSRREKASEPDRAGSAVRKYQASFATAGPRRREVGAGSADDDRSAHWDNETDEPAAG